MSRRSAETEIANGNVMVNGVIAKLGDKADPENDLIEYNGKRIGPANRTHTYIMLNKPMGYVTSMSDEKGRKCVTDLIPDIPSRIYPVGRLDMYSEGLLIMTDDGELTNKITHPSGSIGKLYRVKIKGEIDKNALKQLKSPMELDGYRLQPVDIKVVSRGNTDREGNIYSTLLITLYEGRNRQIRRMCEKCGLQVMRLCRIKLGRIELGELPSGQYRHLTEEEIDYLKKV